MIVVSVILTEIGFSFLSGFLLLIIFMPLKALLAKIFHRFKSKKSQIADERTTVLTEIFSAINIIKMYCWEVPFTKKAQKLRK